MKNKLLAPPTTVGVSQTSTFRSHSYHRFGRLLSVTLLVLFALMPFEKAKAQWPSFTFYQSATDLCNGSVEFDVASPSSIPPGYFVDWKLNNVSVGNNTSQFIFNPNQTNSLVTYNITCEITDGNTAVSYGPYSVTSISALYVKRSSSTINSCSTSITLDASVNGAVLSNGITNGIQWYSYDPTTSTSTYISGGSQYLNISANNGIHYYYYTSTANGCTVQSGMYTVNVITSLTITSSDPNLEPGAVLSLSPSNITSPPLFNDLNWYRNGVMIPEATSTSYTAIAPGNYYLMAVYPSPCAAIVSNTITITCDPTGIVTKTNYTFPNGTTTLSGFLKFSGTIVIPAGAVVNISNAKIHMTNCSEILVDKNSNINQAGGKLNITNTSISGCDPWKWIKVLGNNGVGNPVQNGLLTLGDVQIRDADMAIYTLNGGTLSINNTLFENNSSHLTVVNCPNIASSINNSTFSYLRLTNSCNIGNIYPVVNANYNNVIKLVYIHSSSGLTFSNSNFNPLIIKNWLGGSLSPTPNGFEAYNCNKSVNASYSINLMSCSLNGVFNQGAYFSLCESPLVNGTTNATFNIEGDFTNVFYFYQCNKPSITDQKMHPSTSSQNYLRGILSYQSDKLYCYNNKVSDFERGLEFYQQTASNNQTIIQHNSFLNNKYGVVIAPEVFPVGNVANPNLNLPYYNNQRNVKLLCNKFNECEWGVTGVGNIITQSTVNGNTNNDWDCFFTSGNNNYSKKADVAWYDRNTANNSIRQIVVYYDQNTYQFGFSNAYSISLDGNSITSNNFFQTYITQNPNIYNGCRNSFKTDPLPQFDSLIGKLIIYPNPFENKFTIKNDLNALTNYILYDMTGKVINYGYINGPNEIQIDATILPIGCYFIKLIDHTTGKSIKTEKLIKIND